VYGGAPGGGGGGGGPGVWGGGGGGSGDQSQSAGGTAVLRALMVRRRPNTTYPVYLGFARMARTAGTVHPISPGGGYASGSAARRVVMAASP
jgi:hypothetical protein